MKDPLRDITIRAIELDQYGEEYYEAIRSIFPYNLFTIKVRTVILDSYSTANFEDILQKFIKRDIYTYHTQSIKDQIDELIRQLTIEVDSAMPSQIETYEASMDKYRQALQEWQNQTSQGVGTNGETVLGGTGDSANNTNEKDALKARKLVFKP